MTINYNKAEFIRSAVRPEAFIRDGRPQVTFAAVSYTHLRAHETDS